MTEGIYDIFTRKPIEHETTEDHINNIIQIADSFTQ